MRRAIAIFLVSVLFLSGACAEMPDFSAMSQSEILDVINAGRNALVLSEQPENELFRLETDIGVTIVFTGLTDDFGFVYIKALVINDADVSVRVSGKDYYVNGYSCAGFIYSELKSKRRENALWELQIEGAGISDISEVEDVEIYLSIRPDGMNAIDIQDPIVLSFK